MFCPTLFLEINNSCCMSNERETDKEMEVLNSSNEVNKMENNISLKYSVASDTFRLA